jgi:predicted KAP-like P-loop ATPase
VIREGELGSATSSLLIDQPIENPSSDRLRRLPLAKQLAQLVRRALSDERSTVFAIVGPWGSGKSSLMNLAVNELAEMDLKVVSFNPWLVGSVESLLGDFFSSLLEKMPSSKTDKAKQKVKSFGEKAAPLTHLVSLVPGVGKSASTVIEAASKIGSKSMNSLRSEAEAVLRDAATSYLFVIDDIDRLQTDELLMLFKVVRLIGRLPNVHYLLAFDEETVLDVLTGSSVAKDEHRALAFLEKIVQVRVDVPPLHQTDIQ